MNPMEGDWALKPELVESDLESIAKERKGSHKGTREESETTDEGGIS